MRDRQPKRILDFIFISEILLFLIFIELLKGNLFIIRSPNIIPRIGSGIVIYKTYLQAHGKHSKMSKILDLKTMMMTLIWKTHAVIKDAYVCMHAIC